MAGTIELPTLIQKIRVDTRSMNRAEKAAGKFGATADSSFHDAADASDDYARSSDDSERATRRLDSAVGDLGKTVKETKGTTAKFSDDVDDTSDRVRGLGDNTDDTNHSLGLLTKGFKSAGGGASLLGGAMGSMKLQVITTGVTLLAGGLSALTAGAIGFIGQVAPLVGVLGSIPAALGALLSTKLLFSSLIKGPTDAAKAIQKYGAASKQAKEALKKLTPEGRKFTLELVKTQNAFTKARDVAGRDAFPGLSFALESVRRLMPIIQRGMKGVAAVIGETATAFADFADSKAFHRDFGLIVDRNTKLVSTLGQSLVPLLKVFINITKAAGPMTQAFADAFLKGAKFLAALTGSDKGQKRLTKFFEKTQHVVFSLGRTFRDLGVGLFNLFSIGAKHSTDFLGSMEKLAKKFRAFTESTEGKGKLAKFFEDAKPVLHEIALLIRDVFKGIGRLSGDANLAPLISQIRTDLLPAFLDFAGAVNSNIAPVLVKLATAFLDFQKVLTFSPLVAVAGAFADLTIAITKIIDKVPGLSTLVATLLAFSLATKGIALAGKVTGVTKLVEGLTSLGPAGKAGQKGIAGFVQGLRGASGAGGKLTVANIFGRAVKGAGKAGKTAGSAFLGGISRAVSAVGSAGSAAGRGIVSGLGRLASGAATAGTRVGTAFATGLARTASAAASAGSAIGRGVLSGLSILRGGVVTALSKIGPLLTVVANGLKVATGAARAFALALLANPVVLIIAGLVALGIALVVLYKRSETFRNIVNGAFTAVKNVVVGVFNFLRGFIVGTFNFIRNVITTAVKVIATIIRTYFNIYRTIITTVFRVIRAVISGAWNVIRTVVGNAVKFIARVITTYVAIWRTLISRALDVIRGLFRLVFQRIPEIVRERLGGIVRTFAGLGGRILSALGNFGELLFNAGKELILGLARGIGRVASAPIDAVKGILHGIGRLLPGSPVKDGPLRVLNRGYAGGQVAKMFAEGIDKKRSTVEKSAKALAGVANLASTIGGTGLAVAGGQPGVRGGGLTQITYDQRKTYDVDVHETTGPSTEDSLTRRLATISLLGPQAATMGVLVGG